MNPSVLSLLNESDASDVLSHWGQAAQVLYGRFHVLNDILNHAKDHPIPEADFQKVNHLQQLLIETLVDLTEDMPAEEALPAAGADLSKRLNTHIRVINEVVEQVDATLATLYQQHPALPR